MNNNVLLTILIIVTLSVFVSCASTPEPIETVADTTGEAFIEYIDIFDNQIRIKVSQPSEYIVYKPGDPFKVVVGLPGVDPGPYQEKIISEKEGITEINPILITEPNISTKLEILLENPSSLVPEMSGDLLVLTVKKDEIVAMDEEAVVETEEIAQEEAIPEAEVMTEVEVAEEAAIEAAAAVEEGPAEEEVVVEEPAEVPVEETVEVPQVVNITGIEFERVEDAVKILIMADSDIHPDVLPLEGRLVLDFENVEMKAEAPKEVAYPLKGMRWGQHGSKTRVVLDLTSKASYDVVAINNTVIISLSAPDMMVPIAEGEAGPEAEEAVGEAALAAERAVETEPVEEAVALEIEEGKYAGKRISLDFQDADIVPIFRLFADVSGYNFVISPKVKGKITMKLINVPWDQALDLVLRTHNLGKQIDGNIIRIATNEDLQNESESKAKAKEALVKAKPLETKIFTVNYAGVERISEAIDKSKLISPRGSMTLDERASVIIVNDVSDTFPKIEELIADLDKPELQVRQVLIEARIVEAATSFVRELGIQWGASGRTTDFQVKAGGTGLAGVSSFTNSNFIVNMPAAVGQGSGAAFGVGYLNAARTLGIDLQLSALERTGKGKVVSNPRIITMNNTAAKIVQGNTIYVPVATADKTDVKPIEANLTLDVTPTIAPGGAILMEITIHKDEPGDVVAGNISINTNHAETTTLINSGDTIVIGGIYRKRLITADDGVPGLSKIPVLGLLFKHKRTQEEVSEILIFITPKVVKYDLPDKDKKVL